MPSVGGLKAEALDLKKRRIGPLPFIDAVLKQLRWREIMGTGIKNQRYIEAIEAVLKSILVEPAALYRIPEWAAQCDSAYFPGDGELGDDVLGRALEALFTADRASLMTRLTLATIKAYEIDVSQLHNDSTSIKFYGAYKRQYKNAIKLKRGHSKDHRPDLKQLVYNLTIAADGSVPIHFKAHDGNRTDDTLHIDTWLTLRAMLVKSDFLYVADSKLCVAEVMRKIEKEGGRFLTVVPKTRAETKEFAELCYAAVVRWAPLTRRQASRQKGYDVFQVADGAYQLEEGYRVYWYRSSEKRRRDEESRHDRITSAWEALREIETKPGKGRRTAKSLLRSAEKILEKYKASDWIKTEVKTREEHNFKKTSSGKPGPNATFRRITRQVPYLVISKDLEQLAHAEAMDGVFPLTTNAKLDAKQALEAYKYQPFIERHFSNLKSDYQVAPVFLKKTTRIEALMFVCYMADLVAALVQRTLRQAMVTREVQELSMLPEERSTKTPTWEQVQRLFANHNKYELCANGHIVKTYWDELTEIQRTVIDLLDLPTPAFAG